MKSAFSLMTFSFAIVAIWHWRSVPHSRFLKGLYNFPEGFYSLSPSKWISLFCNFSKMSEFDKIQIFGIKMESSDNNSFTAEKIEV